MLSKLQHRYVIILFTILFLCLLLLKVINLLKVIL